MLEENEVNILICSSDGEFRSDMRSFVENEGYTPLTRSSIERALQLLDLAEIFMIITDYELDEGNCNAFLKELKGENCHYSDLPIFVVGSHDNPEQCITVFENGADEYLGSPYNQEIFRARLKKLITTKQRIKSNPVTLSLRVEDKEVPGILQFLEAENKTGILNASFEKENAEIIFHEGKVISASTKYCEEKEALTEVLTWPYCNIKFTESTINPTEYDNMIIISHALMDCVFEVDEFKEVKTRLPDFETSFLNGSESLPSNSNRIAKKIHRMAITGHGLGELLEAVDMNKRHMIMLIDQLIENDFLTIAPDSFDNYIEEQQNHYSSNRSFFESHIPTLQNNLENLNFPLDIDLRELPFENADNWAAETPKVVIAGDSPEFNQQFFETFSLLSAALVHSKSNVKSIRSNESHCKLKFPDNKYLDLQKLPSTVDQLFIKQFAESTKNVAGVIFIVSSQDKETAQKNRRLLKQLRSCFKGFFIVLAPQLNEEDTEFFIDCPHCHHKLGVNMELAGSMGNCPICSSEMTIPDCLDHLNWSLKLPNEIPCVLMQPKNPEHMRDIVTLMFSSIIEIIKAL